MASTTPRAVRVPDDLWAAAIDKARAEGTTVTAVVTEALAVFVGRNAPRQTVSPDRVIHRVEPVPRAGMARPRRSPRD